METSYKPNPGLAGHLRCHPFFHLGQKEAPPAGPVASCTDPGTVIMPMAPAAHVSFSPSWAPSLLNVCEQMNEQIDYHTHTCLVHNRNSPAGETLGS